MSLTIMVGFIAKIVMEIMMTALVVIIAIVTMILQ